MFLGDRAQREHVAAAGVGKEDIQSAGGFRDLCVHRIEIGEHRGVGTDGRGSRADGFDGGVQFGLAAAGDEDAGTLRGEFLCGAEADAGAAAGDQCNFTSEGLVHDELLSFAS